MSDREQFVAAPDGTLDFGEVPAESGRQAAKIRLRLGDEKSGLLHIQRQHEDQIRAKGFSSVEHFVYFIAQNFTSIYKVTRPNSRGLELVVSDIKRGKLIVQLEPDPTQDFYDVKTATPIRSDQYKHGEPLWSRTGPSTRTAEADPLFPGAKAVSASVGAQAYESKLPDSDRRLRVLIVRVGAMGDVLHGLPAVTALREALPKAFLGWAIEPRWSSLLQAREDAIPGGSGMPLVDRVHAVEARLWSKRPVSLTTLRSILRLRRELRAERYDVAIDLQGSLRSAVIARLSGAKVIVGSASPRESAAKYFYGIRVETNALHVVEQAWELASVSLGQIVPGPAPSMPSRTRLPLDIDAERWAEALLQGETRRIVLLAPTAGWGAKQWPAERYGELAARLQAGGCRVLVNAMGPNDDVARKVAEAAARGGSPPLELVDSTLPQLTALLRRCALVVAGDTGPLHLAAALGRPVVALFGPTDPARNGPYGTRSIVLRDPASVTDHRRHSTTEAGLQRISVDEVFVAATRLLEDEQPPIRSALDHQ